MTDDELIRRAPDPRSIPTSPGERALFRAQEAAKDLAAQNDELRKRVAELELALCLPGKVPWNGEENG